MTAPREPDRLIRAVLEEGPNVLPDRVLDSVLGEVHRTRQRARFGPWRTMPMSRSAYAAVAIVAVVAIGSLALWANRSSGGPSVGAPSADLPAASAAAALPTASPSPTPSPSPSPSPAPIASLPVGVKAPGTILFGRHDPTTDTTTLLAILPDGTGQRQLVAPDACCLVTSPDDGFFVYAMTLGGRLAPGSASFAPGSNPEEYWTWTGSDGNGTIDSSGLNLVPGAVGKAIDVAFEGWDDQKPDRTGVYVSIDNGGGQARGVLKRLTTNPGTLHDVPIGFSPDGSKLLFVRDRVPGDRVRGDLYVIGTDGTHLRRLSPDTARVDVSNTFGPGASWSRDGTTVAFSGFDPTRSDGSSAVYVVDASKGSAKAITDTGSWTTSARFSPDGQWIAFDKGMPGGLHDIFLVHPDGSGLKDITTSFDVGVCCGQWSPDGRWLVVQGSLTGKDAETDLFVVSTVDSTVERLTSDPVGYRQWVTWIEPASPTP